jgi:hypothetical protein
VKTIVAYIRCCYIHWLLYWLIDKYNIRSSVIEVRLSVLTDEYILVLCSDDLKLDGLILLKKPNQLSYTQ